jgi:GAF domain-containing protein
MDTKLAALYDLGQKLLLVQDAKQISETVLEIADDVLDLGDSEFLLVDDATRELWVAAQRGDLEVAAGLRLPLDGERGITVAAARSGEALYVPDVRQDPRYVDVGFPAVSELAVPVQFEGRVLGVVNVESEEVDAYDAEDVQLLSILASQAALALENAFLHAQERRRAEETAAINQVARRISASLDLRETLDGIVEAAAELVPCVLAEISLWDEKEQMLTLQALRCEPRRAFPIGQSYPPGEGYTGWLVRHKRPLLVRDVRARKEIRPQLLPGEHPFEAYVGVPLLAGEELIGTLVLIHDRPAAFDEGNLDLLQALAGQAALAIRNASLYEELARRHGELMALNAVAQVISESLTLQEIMDQAVAKVTEVMEVDIGSLRLLNRETGELPIVSHQGLSAAYIQAEGHISLSDDDPVGRVARSGEPVVVPELSRVHISDRLAVTTQEFRAFAIVPVRSRDRILGTLGVATRSPREFSPEELDLLTAIAHQLGIAIENARLRREALDAERLAAVGRVAASVAHELRTPLGGIMRSAEFLARPELSGATREKLSQAIVAMAGRLVTTTQELLDYCKGGRMALAPTLCSLPGFLDEMLEVLRVDFSDRGIEVQTAWGYEGDVWMDPDRMAQVVYNIAANARDAMPDGGRLRVATQRVGQWVELRFSDTGPGVPPDLHERIFEPFVSYGKRQGAGLGLAIARRIVREHGGEIGLDELSKEGATFVVRIPLERGAGVSPQSRGESTRAA